MIGRIGSPTMSDHCGSAHCGPFRVRAWANSALVNGQVLAPLRPHAAVGAREAHRLALDGDDDEAHGLWCRGKRAEREAPPLLAVVEVDLALGHGLADIGELVAHRLEMRPQALLDHVDRDLVELARRGIEVALGGEVGDADHRHHGEEDQPDEHDRQQPRDRPA